MHLAKPVRNKYKTIAELGLVGEKTSLLEAILKAFKLSEKHVVFLVFSPEDLSLLEEIARKILGPMEFPGCKEDPEIRYPGEFLKFAIRGALKQSNTVVMNLVEKPDEMLRQGAKTTGLLAIYFGIQRR